jgi:hypothetical protein
MDEDEEMADMLALQEQIAEEEQMAEAEGQAAPEPPSPPPAPAPAPAPAVAGPPQPMAAAAGPSGAQVPVRRPARRAGPRRSYVGQDGDAQSDASSEAGGPSAAARPHRTVHGREDDAHLGQGLGGDDAASSYSVHHLNKGLSDVPGWRSVIMGVGIKPEPPVFATGLPGHWVQVTNSGPFKPGKLCRPARVIDFGFVGAWQQASDAERISDMNAQTEQVARARTVATCALMGMLSMGTAKGLVASPNHSELVHARAESANNGNGDDSDDDDQAQEAKRKRKLHGKIKTYTYCPNEHSNDANIKGQTAMMFCYVHIAMHDRAGKYVGFKILQLIFDKGFSTDDLVRRVMEENATLKASGQINGMPEDLRNGRFERQCKMQRTQISDENLETTAAIQYRRICSNQDWIKFMDSVGGQVDGHEGRPYYANISKDTRAGCATDPFLPHKEWGGKHPIGPSVSHNHKRHAYPTDDHPGVNVFTAGTLDARGAPIDLHPSLVDPTEWYDANGYFDPPQHVKDMGWCHMCHDASVINIFSAPLPQKRTGNVEPDDILLKQYWTLYKDTNPILVKAQHNGLTTFEQNRDSVRSLFHREDDLDPEQRRLSRAVLETELLGNDSIDKSAAEEAMLERRAYGTAQTEQNGNVWVFSVRQVQRDISIEQEKVHAMTIEYDKQRRAELRSANYNAQPGSEQVFNQRAETRKRQREHNEATTACIKLGLQRFEHAYGRKKARKFIPPGYFDVGHLGLKDALKEAGEIAARLHSRSRGRLVDPENSDAGLGTANIGFAHGQSLVATDFTPFGHHRAFLMSLFSSGLRIAGGDVKLMLDMHCHAFEPFQEVSYFLLLCGGAGSGKSMRAKRLQALLPEGWVKGSGSGSAKAGMNGGMDYLCGRLVYFDEIPDDFASTDSARIEYLKSVTMEQRVMNQRTVKVTGENGVESFTTVVLDSLHYESYLICTNCGPLGLKGENTEPSTNRTALTDRTWAHIVHSAEDEDETGNVEFDIHSLSDEVKQQVNRYRVCSSLVAYVLIFIKHIPSCRPNLTYANMLTNKWYDMLWQQYNLQKPTKRKKIKLRMLLELFATESAVFEKFMLRESGVDFEDMHPDENGFLSPFCIEQLTDVVRSLQRCVDFEVIHTAWSHSLDHSPMTSAHRFQMMTELAGLHGSGLDDHSMEGGDGPLLTPEPPKNAQGKQLQPDPQHVADQRERHARWRAGQSRSADAAPAPDVALPQFAQIDAPPRQGRVEEPEDDDDVLAAMMDAPATSLFADAAAPAAASATDAVMAVVNGQRGADDAPAETQANLATGTNLLPQQQPPPVQPPPVQPPPQGPVPLTPQQQADWDNRYKGPAVPAKSTSGVPANATIKFVRMMDKPVSRQQCGKRARELAERREFKCEMQRRLVMHPMPQHREGQKKQLIKLFTDKLCEKTKKPMLRIEATGKWVDAAYAAEKCLPDAQNALNSGIEPNALQNWVQGNPTDARGLGDHSTTGLQKQEEWEYKMREPSEGSLKMPADYDFNWAILKAFNKASGGDAPTASGPKQKSVWSNSAREIMKKTKGGSSSYSLMKVKSMTVESMRDTLFQMAQSLGENKVHIPRYNIAGRHKLNEESRMLSQDGKFDDASNPPGKVHPNCQADPGFRKANGPEERLAHLIDKRALPSCILPESYERGVPVMECEASNGIYVNKHVMSQHAALVVESSNYLMEVPGIACGNSAEVPDSFQVKKDEPNDASLEAMELVEQARREAAAKRKAEAEAEADAAEGAPAAKQPRTSDQASEAESGEEAAEDKEEDFAESDHGEEGEEEGPALSESETPRSLRAAEKSVSRPESEDFDAHPRPGASDKAAGASVDPSAKQETLPLLWDHGAMFFSMKMIETLHNDCHDYVKKVAERFPDVYGDEELEETLQKLPHIALRFPGTLERDKNMLLPLSCPIPLEESEYCDVAKQVESSRASKGLTEAVQSFAHGRAVAFNDPEVLEFEAEARGVNSGFVMKGNLFARSTWQRFTLSALDARGMRTPEEEKRVNDQGLCMSHRVRNHMAASAEPVRGVDFGPSTLAVPMTFAAQERELRKKAQEVADERVMQSAAAQIHAREAETMNEVMEEALDETFEA